MTHKRIVLHVGILPILVSDKKVCYAGISLIIITDKTWKFHAGILLILFTDKTKVFHAGIYCLGLLILVTHKLSRCSCWNFTDSKF